MDTSCTSPFAGDASSISGCDERLRRVATSSSPGSGNRVGDIVPGLRGVLVFHEQLLLGLKYGSDLIANVGDCNDGLGVLADRRGVRADRGVIPMLSRSKRGVVAETRVGVAPRGVAPLGVAMPRISGRGVCVLVGFGSRLCCGAHTTVYCFLLEYSTVKPRQTVSAPDRL